MATAYQAGCGNLKEDALRAALYIATRLKDPQQVLYASALAKSQSQFPEFTHWSPMSIGRGNAGLCLLWAYLDECFPEEGWDVTGKAHLELAGRHAEVSPHLGSSLFSGLSGLAFAAVQLSRRGTRYRRLLLSLDEAIARDAIDLASRARNSDTVPVNDFDIISGLSGIGAYLLCRREERPCAPALSAIVDGLISLVTRDVIPAAWYTPASLLFDDSTRASYPSGNLNCGLAHGIPGVLALLSLVKLSGLPFETLDRAIVTIGDWLATHRLDDEWGENWPAVVPLEAVERDGETALAEIDLQQAPCTPSRAAWCYGSPGVARALWLAGRAVDREDYCALAVSAMQAVFRRPIPARMIDSPTFCHGVAGLLAITMRFANDTGSAPFQGECCKLTGQILEAFQPGSLLGLRNLEYGNNETDEPGFLDGASGVAAVLLAAATGIEPTWDRVFLLS